MNAILGAGILGQAYAMKSAGIAIFAVLLLCTATVAFFAIELLARACDECGVESYEELGLAAYGRTGRAIAGLAVIVQNIGAMSSYNVILGDVLPPMLKNIAKSSPACRASHWHGAACSPWWADRSVLMVACCLLVVLPLTTLRNIGALGYSSSVSICVMVTLAITALAYGGPHADHGAACPPPDVEPVEGGCDIEAVQFNLGTFFVLPTLAFSFVCHTALLPIYRELKDKSRQKLLGVAGVAMGGAFALYLATALGGYLAFGSYVQDDVLESFAAIYPDNAFITTVRVLVCVSVAITIPLINFPARNAMTLVFFPGRKFSWARHLVMGFGLVLVVLVVAILVPQIKDVFGIIGATSAVTLMAILPGLFFLRVMADPEGARRRLAHARLQDAAAAEAAEAEGQAGGQASSSIQTPGHANEALLARDLQGSAVFGASVDDLLGGGEGSLARGHTPGPYEFSAPSPLPDLDDVAKAPGQQSEAWWQGSDAASSSSSSGSSPNAPAWEFCLAQALIVLGVVVGIVSLSGEIYQFATGDS